MEIKIEPEEISSILKKQIETYQVSVDMEEVGEVIEAGDLALYEDLRSRRYG